MRTEYDVIVVGARIAGSTLAYELSRAGYDVLLLEKGILPSDTLSTHNLFNNSVAMLREMGVLDRLLETGTPLYKRAYIRFEDAELAGDFPEADGESGCLCVRRKYLDQTLHELACAQERVTSLQGFRVKSLIEENGTITGVVGARKEDGVEQQFFAKLVVGADGRNSTVRSLVNSQQLHCVPTDYASYVGYFTGYEQTEQPQLEFYRMNDCIAIVFPTSDNQHVVGLMFPLEQQEWIQRFMDDSELTFRERIKVGLKGSLLADKLQQAALAEPIRGLLGYNNDWYEGMGAGWALLGDAMSFKDPAVGQGMHDAIYSARLLTKILAEHADWSGSWDVMSILYNEELKAMMMSRFGMACEMTRNVPMSEEQKAVNRLISASPAATQAFLGIYNYTTEPEKLGQVIGELLIKHNLN